MTNKANTTELLKRTFIEMMKDVGTSIPGHVLAFDHATQLAQIQIGVRRVKNDGEQVVPPPLIECPVYIYGGAYAVDVQIDPGIEGVVLFSQRCIDGWVNTGGVADNPILRFHDFSDAYFLPGLRSQPNKLPAFENNGIRLRNPDGSKYIWLKNDGTADITVDTLTINANIVHNGNQTTSGVIEAPTVNGTTSLTAAGKEMAGHTHPAGDPPGDTGPNN